MRRLRDTVSAAEPVVGVVAVALAPRARLIALIAVLSAGAARNALDAVASPLAAPTGVPLTLVNRAPVPITGSPLGPLPTVTLPFAPEVLCGVAGSGLLGVGTTGTAAVTGALVRFTIPVRTLVGLPTAIAVAAGRRPVATSLLSRPRLPAVGFGYSVQPPSHPLTGLLAGRLPPVLPPWIRLMTSTLGVGRLLVSALGVGRLLSVFVVVRPAVLLFTVVPSQPAGSAHSRVVTACTG